ncbi:hypothetical protein [Helicobacter cinaedi]|uniref:hypothetical protein n=1 Tax=Helicobacter cinaedi TaxID=213 RepID=UPI000DC6EA42|nr:hypothetical protein [Helicobacter cinaedi]BBB20296.1 hypothetical protein HC081234_14730 [Helicobacter cinaedi]
MPPLNPLLESDSIECLHKGKVIFQSSTKDLMCVQDSNNNDAGLISLGDLANATIIGCTDNIAGIPSPCTKLVNIPNSICSTLLEIDNQKIVLAQATSQVITDKGSPLILQGEPKAKDIFEIDEDITKNAQNTQSNNIKSISESSGDSNLPKPLPQRYASNDNMAFRDLIKWQTNRKVRLLFYGGVRKVGDNSSFYYASLNVLRDYKKHHPNDIYEHKFIDSAKTIVDIINEQKPNSITSLDLFFHGSKWGLYMYRGSSMSKNLSKDEIQTNNLNAGLYASKTTDFLSATYTHTKKRTIYDIKFDRFIAQGAYIEIHGCESGGDLVIIDSIAKNLSEEILQGYVVEHITKANPNINNTKDVKKQDYRHGKRAIWQNGKVIKETSQKGWLNFEELLQ